MKKAFPILFFLISINIFSQELKEKNWNLKIDALQLVDIFSYPTLQVSVERKINPYFSINTEFGYQIYDLKEKTDTIYFKPKGFKANIETRLYLSKFLAKRVQSKQNEFFVGLQVFYRQNQSSNSIEFSPENEPSKQYIDNFGTKRNVKGFNITSGYQIFVNKKLLLEPYIGLGFQNKKITNTNLEYNKDKDILNGVDMVPFFQSLNLEESSGNQFNFCLGFRIGFRL